MIGDFTFAAVSIAALIVSVPVVLTAGIAKLFVFASLYNASNSLPNKTPDLYLLIVYKLNNKYSISAPNIC
jgi:hypothetical protein